MEDFPDANELRTVSETINTEVKERLREIQKLIIKANENRKNKVTYDYMNGMGYRFRNPEKSIQIVLDFLRQKNYSVSDVEENEDCLENFYFTISWNQRP